jgi:thiol:disulfide interchange protein DsbD
MPAVAPCGAPASEQRAAAQTYRSVKSLDDVRVQTLLAKVVWLRADVTANDATDKALLKPFGVTGVPQILFFRRDGQQRKDLLLAGYSKPEDLVQRLEQALR